MDPAKKIGQIKEQCYMENKARRNYPKKWFKPSDQTLWKQMYNQNTFNQQLKEDLKLKDLCPYEYTGQGESYFVSCDMYKSLMSSCRCGEPRTGAHMLKCLQKQKNTFLHENEEEGNDEVPMKIPETSNSFIGWHSSDTTTYKRWEQSMRYTSPLQSMPGPKITSHPYHAIIIG
ncbi:uncharacterized protein ACN427_005912 [Glossina fuscipes fuscipes]